MADYLQDLLDRFSVDPTQQYNLTDDTDTQAKKKKKDVQAPVQQVAQQAGMLPYSQIGGLPQVSGLPQVQTDIPATSQMSGGNFPAPLPQQQPDQQPTQQQAYYDPSFGLGSYTPGLGQGGKGMGSALYAVGSGTKKAVAALNKALGSNPQQDQPAPAMPGPEVTPTTTYDQPQGDFPAGKPQVPTPPAPPVKKEASGDTSAGAEGGTGDQGDRGGGGRTPYMGVGGGPNQIERAGMMPSDGGNIFDKIMSGLGAHSNLLLAMGAGLMGAPNVAQGLGRGFAYAGPAMQQDYKMQQQMAGQRGVMNALRGAGAPESIVQAAAFDEDSKKAAIKDYLIDRGYSIEKQEATNAWGEKYQRYMAVPKADPTKAWYLDSPGEYIDGSPRNTADIGPGGVSAGGGPGGAPGGGPGGAPGGGGGMGGPQGQQSAFYAPGINDQNVDQTKHGEDYLAQFSPEVQAYTKDYLAGRALPTGRQQVMKRIEMIARKYGDDIGMPADPSLITQRQTWARSLADTKGGVGMQAKGFEQGLDHATTLSDKLVALHLSNGLGLEKGANFMNWLKSQTTAQQGRINEAGSSAQALAGEVGKLYSGSQGGGVHERELTSQRLGNAYHSGEAAAGSLESTLELMQGGLRALEERRDQLFPGGTAPRGSEFSTARQDAQIEHIKHNIKILRGEIAADQAAPAGATVPQPKGTYNYDKTTGGFTLQQ